MVASYGVARYRSASARPLISPFQATEGRAGRPLLPFEIIELADDRLLNQQFRLECASAFVAMIRGFILDSISRRVIRFRKLHGMYEAEEHESDLDERTDFNMGTTSMYIALSKLLY